jgi:ketosteroid isomerase-like protein
LRRASNRDEATTPSIALEASQQPPILKNGTLGGVVTFRGDVMNTQDLAKNFTEMCTKGEFDAAGKKFWSDEIVSREPMTGDMAELKGRKAVEGKGEWWYSNHTIHNVKVEGPYVHGDQFVVRFKMEVTPKGGKRMNLDEVGLYTVKNGKIVEERFFMGGH